jgi:hypothetical protein
MHNDGGYGVPGADENRRPSEPDREMLREQEVARLFARASELDAVRGAGSQIADLRATAAEAGISASAFDAALAEMRDSSRLPTPPVREVPRPRRRLFHVTATAAIAFVLVIGSYAVSRLLVGSATPAPPAVVAEEAILLSCMAPGDAAELVRPLLHDPSGSIVQSPRAPRVLTIRGTPQQLQEAKSLLGQHDVPGSPACGVRPPTP